MLDFESLCGLPCCGGAIDSTFMPIKKPSDFGDTYYCYKHFTAIIVLGCVDAQDIFTYVNAGRPGSVGDSNTYRHSLLYQRIANGEWLSLVLVYLADHQTLIATVCFTKGYQMVSGFPRFCRGFKHFSPQFALPKDSKW